jgi:hypothetical protein
MNLDLLKSLEPFMGRESLYTGREFEGCGNLRAREILVNLLLCAVGDYLTNTAGRFSIKESPSGGDGLIVDYGTGDELIMEHILIPSFKDPEKDAATLILEAINSKQNKGGKAYASGKTLVVLLDARRGQWFPNEAAKRLPEKIDFEAVWVVSLQKVEEGEYVYGVSRLDLRQGNPPIWTVRINKDFNWWKVEPIQ